MRRIVLLLSILAVVAAGALPAIAADDGKVQRFAQDETLGFYRGTTVAYLDFGPVKLSAGNKVAPIWAFTNGATGQHNIIDTVPGRSDYTPLWAVRLVTWKDGQSARVLRSAAAVRRAAAAGQVSVSRCPLSSTAPCCRQTHQLTLHLDEAVARECRDGLVVELRSLAHLYRHQP